MKEKSRTWANEKVTIMNFRSGIHLMALMVTVLTLGCMTNKASKPFEERVLRNKRRLADQEARAWVQEITPYALMSEVTYKKGESQASKKKSNERWEMRDEFLKWLATNGWMRVENRVVGLPMAEDSPGLYFDLWRKTNGGSPKLTVAFRGTESADIRDWQANFRWLPFLDRSRDEYAQVERLAAAAVAAELVGMPADTEVITTGHSLGGGLAQHLFYNSYMQPAPMQIKRCYVFDPSPVTGWFQGKDAGAARANQQDRLAHDWKAPQSMLKEYHFGTVRLYEHGEVLESFRTLFRWFVPLRNFITELRVDVIRGGGLVTQHSMAKLAKGILKYPERVGGDD